MREEDVTVRAFGDNTYGAYGTGTPPREGSGGAIMPLCLTHHAITDPDEMIRHVYNWEKVLPSEGIKAKVRIKCHVSFFAWTAQTRSTSKVPFDISNRTRSRSRNQS